MHAHRNLDYRYCRSQEYETGIITNTEWRKTWLQDFLPSLRGRTGEKGSPKKKGRLEKIERRHKFYDV